MRLVTYNELICLGCNPTEYKCTKNFVYKNINYWSAYAYDYNDMWIATVAGFLNGDEDLWHDNLLGARPVITINKSEI